MSEQCDCISRINGQLKEDIKKLRALLVTAQEDRAFPWHWVEGDVAGQDFLGNTAIYLRRGYAGSQEHCLLIQEALRLLPDLLDAIDPPVKAKEPRERHTTILMPSGKRVDLLNFSAEDVDWRDIISVLRSVPRWNNRTRQEWTVDKHSMLVCGFIGDGIRTNKKRVNEACALLLAGLLHDAHEAYIGDIITPVKNAIEHLSTGIPINRLTDHLDRAIYTAAGLPWPLPDDWISIIRKADKAALDLEYQNLIVQSEPTDLGISLPEVIFGDYERCLLACLNVMKGRQS